MLAALQQCFPIICVPQHWHRCPDGTFKPADRRCVSSSSFLIISFNISMTHSYPSYFLLTNRFATGCTSSLPYLFSTQGGITWLAVPSPSPIQALLWLYPEQAPACRADQTRPSCPAKPSAEPHTPLKTSRYSDVLHSHPLSKTCRANSCRCPIASLERSRSLHTMLPSQCYLGPDTG